MEKWLSDKLGNLLFLLPIDCLVLPLWNKIKTGMKREKFWLNFRFISSHSESSRTRTSYVADWFFDLFKKRVVICAKFQGRNMHATLCRFAAIDSGFKRICYAIYESNRSTIHTFVIKAQIMFHQPHIHFLLIFPTNIFVLCKDTDVVVVVELLNISVRRYSDRFTHARLELVGAKQL